jgi:hypothetical protein
VWGSDPRFNTSVAPSFFGQSLLAEGQTLALFIVCLIALVLVVSCRRIVATRSSYALIYLLIIVRLPFYVERDFQSVLVATLRSLVVAFVCLALARWALGSTERRLETRPHG